MSSTKNPLHRLFGVDVAKHGDQSDLVLDRSQNLEVICLGLSRTGTTSLQFALPMIGFGPCHGGVDLFRSPQRMEAFHDIFTKVLSGVWSAGSPEMSRKIVDLMAGYRSCTDTPLCYLAPEVYAAYPNAKYILTVRPDGAEGWYNSFWNSVSWHFRRDVWRWLFRFSIYPVSFLRRNDDKVGLIREIWIKKWGGVNASIYPQHNAEVESLIPKQQLLIYNVREGWEPLCKFLDVEVPKDTPFPNTNDAQAMKAIYASFIAFGLCTWATYLSGAALAVFVAIRPEVALEPMYRIFGRP